MNYYEHHIGDYAAATSHLTFAEDAAYSRLLRIYYRDEKPLPSELRAVQRLVGARSREEREAVDTVLNEFFVAGPDGWHNKRADEEIEKVIEKREKARRSAEARWKPGKPACDRMDSGMRSHSERNATASETHNGRNAHHTPDTRHQSPDKELLNPPHTTAASNEPERGVGTPAGHAAAELNRLGVRITSQDPRLLEAVAAGVSTERLVELHHLYPDKPAGYLIAAARRQLAEAATTGDTHAARPRSGKPSLAERVQQHEHDVIDGEARRVG